MCGKGNEGNVVMVNNDPGKTSLRKITNQEKTVKYIQCVCVEKAAW